MKALKLTVRAIRRLQEDHDIENLLAPGPKDAGNLATLGFLVDAYFEGSRCWGDEAPTREAIEDLTLPDLLAAVKGALSGTTEGNG